MRLIDAFPVDNNRSMRLDWNLILDGNTRELEQGIDFDGPPEPPIRSARAAARRRGITVHVCTYIRAEDQRVVVAVKADREPE
jgi:hypothetical protein